MNNAEFQLRGIGDPRLAVHATSPFSAWLWSIDGTRVLWSNPVGARVFGAANGPNLAKKNFGPADSHRRQVAQLAHRLPPTGAIRLERLRGFGAALGTPITCGCARLDFSDGGQGILIVTAEPVGRAMPLVERLQRLIEGIDTPIAAFARDGMLVGAGEAARSLLGFNNLSEAGLEEARNDALKLGRSETPIGIGHLVLQRVGSGADVGLIALIAPGTTQAAHVRHLSPHSANDAATPATRRIAPPGDLLLPEYERPAMSGEAPAEFALIDEFAETAEEPEVEQIASEPSPELPIAVAAQGETLAAAAVAEIHRDEPASESIKASPSADEPSSHPRRHRLRFTWQMDADGRFSLGPDEFSRLIGVRTAAGFGRPWREIAGTLRLDPDGRVAEAIATRGTWSGITLNWPVDGGCRLPVELSALPIYDHAGKFVGYRGFGVCRDLEGLARLDALRRHEFFNNSPSQDPISSPTLVADQAKPLPAAEPPAVSAVAPAAGAESPAATSLETSTPTDLDTPVDTPKEVLKNVVPFRPISEARTPVLTPVENSAFNELARQLSARLEGENGAPAATLASGAAEAVVEPPAVPETPEESTETAAEPPNWLARPEPPARGEARRDKMLLDLLPDGVLIYRLDRLLYANRAFLELIGYPNLYALEQAGGLVALYVEPGVSSASSTSGTGTPVTISATQDSTEAAPASAIYARLHAIDWDDKSAHALIFSGAGAESATVAAAASPPPPAAVTSAVGHANAEELGTILDTTADGIVMFDAEGNLNSCNRSAEALFGYDGAELVQRNLAELFAPESQPAVRDYLAGISSADAASLLDHGRDVLGRVREG